MYDGMTPRAGIQTNEGLTVAIYFTKPPSQAGHQNQEIHLLKLAKPPQDILEVYNGRD